MSVSVHISYPDDEPELVPLVGANELTSVWMPIVAQHDLNWLDYCFTAGLSIDAENYPSVVSEVELLCRELSSGSNEKVLNDAISRCRQFLKILRENNPQSSEVELYIG